MTEEMFRYEYRPAMSKEKLEKLIIETDKRNQKRKAIRTIKAYVLFSFLYFWPYYWLMDKDILSAIIVALVTAAIFLFIGVIVLGPMFEEARKEDTYLESLKKRYREE